MEGAEEGGSRLRAGCGKGAGGEVPGPGPEEEVQRKGGHQAEAQEDEVLEPVGAHWWHTVVAGRLLKRPPRG